MGKKKKKERAAGLTLCDLALPGARVSVPAKEQNGAPGALVEDLARVGLAQRREPAELLVALLLGHLGELVRKGLDPRLLRLEPGEALGQPVADHGLVHQFLKGHPRVSRALGNHHARIINIPCQTPRA